MSKNDYIYIYVYFLRDYKINSREFFRVRRFIANEFAKKKRIERKRGETHIHTHKLN